MADIAFVLGWGLSEMEGWSVPELMAWHQRAAKRHNLKKE